MEIDNPTDLLGKYFLWYFQSYSVSHLPEENSNLESEEILFDGDEHPPVFSFSLNFWLRKQNYRLSCHKKGNNQLGCQERQVKASWKLISQSYMYIDKISMTIISFNHILCFFHFINSSKSNWITFFLLFTKYHSKNFLVHFKIVLELKV